MRTAWFSCWVCPANSLCVAILTTLVNAINIFRCDHSSLFLLLRYVSGRNGLRKTLTGSRFDDLNCRGLAQTRYFLKHPDFNGRINHGETIRY